jgi:UDP-N-acetylglucosamine 2-epimerase (non-hydrolysing)
MLPRPALHRSIAVVLGTNPELVRLAPLIRELGPAARLVHTGQHRDDVMSGRFLRELDLPEPEVLTGIEGQPRGLQIAASLSQLDTAFDDHRPAAVVVQGDTNATLAGALAANARGVPLVHVDAGLRSRDRALPEEHNRVMVDHISDVLCAATDDNADNLSAEGIPGDRVTVTGNTVVEVVLQQLPDGLGRKRLLARHGLDPDRYVLATVHRPENTDCPHALSAVLAELDRIAGRGTPVLFPMHPRTRAAVIRHGLDRLLERLLVVPPVGYAELLGLARHAALLVSDSDGVQEECTVLGRPLLVVRQSTERPEAVDAGFAVLVPPGPELGALAAECLDDLDARLSRLAATPSPYGDGRASRRIAGLATALTSQTVPPQTPSSPETRRPPDRDLRRHRVLAARSQ